MDDISKEAIISHLATKHNILVSSDDPIFAMLGINEYIIEHFHKSTRQHQQELIGQFREAIDHYAMAMQQVAQLKLSEEIKQHQGEIQSSYKEAEKGMRSTAAKVVSEMKEATSEFGNLQKHGTRWIAFMTAANVFILAAVIVITGLFII